MRYMEAWHIDIAWVGLLSAAGVTYRPNPHTNYIAVLDHPDELRYFMEELWRRIGLASDFAVAMRAPGPAVHLLRIYIGAEPNDPERVELLWNDLRLWLAGTEGEL